MRARLTRLIARYQHWVCSSYGHDLYLILEGDRVFAACHTCDDQWSLG